MILTLRGQDIVLGYESYLSNSQLRILEKQLAHARIDNWINEDVFTWEWLLLIVVLIIPWILWWKCVEKKRLFEITTFGLIVTLLSLYLDATITELGLWMYNIWVGPLNPSLLTADLTIMPVTNMLIYQYCRDWKRFSLSMLIISGVFSFIGEPLLVWLGIYELHEWRHIYSLPIYFIIGLFVKWFVQTLKINMK